MYFEFLLDCALATGSFVFLTLARESAKKQMCLSSVGLLKM